MLVVINNFDDPYFNLASEEYMLRNFKDDCFMLWTTVPTVLLGKNQNALSEINIDYVKEKDIKVVRRITGGGTVFMDKGNMNFGFIMTDNENDFTDFKKFTKPIIQVLRKLGVNAEFSGRNDITIDGKKFSGNAQYKNKNRLLHHGTMLFSSSLNDLTKALKSKPEKFKDKSVKSVASRVTNISSHLELDLTILEFKKLIIDHIIDTYDNVTIYNFSEEDIKKIEAIVEEKYSKWDWNYGVSPKYQYSNEKKFAGGLVEVQFNVKNGLIENIKYYGDFFSRSGLEDIENALIGVKHNEEDIRNTLSKFNIDDYFHNITVDNLIDLLF